MKKSLFSERVFIFFIVFISAIYAFIRYIIIKGLPLADIPLYLCNKVLAFSSVVLLFFSLIFNKIEYFFKKKSDTSVIISTGLRLGLLHGIISILILSWGYFPKFYTEIGTINLQGGWALFFGIISFLTVVEILFFKISFEKILKIFFILVLIHTVITGYDGWLKFSKWPSYLPPFSLIAFFILILSVVLSFLKPSQNKRNIRKR